MKRIILLLLVSIWVLPLQAQHLVKHGPKPRPKVGVVFGGGGAKGAAHIGVLKYLEEIGIPVDYVAGTSIGSIIGGLYAMGYSPDELASLIADMNWSEYVGNKIDRSAMSLETRERSSTFVVNIPFSLDRILHGKLKDEAIGFIPSAYVNNTALINLFNDLCVGYPKEMDFDDLPIPFRCVAVDIKTHKEVIMDSCELELAMRASMAIPGAFKPVRWKGHTLVDGGMLNNLPVDVVLAMGADVVIAIDLEQEDHEDRDFSLKEEFGIGGLLDWLVSRPDWKKAKENRELADVYIRPQLLEFGVSSFSEESIGAMIERGEKAAMKAKNDLKRLRDRIFAPETH